MAMGRAIIATDVGGATEMIENGISGVLLPPGDPVALAEAICDLIEHPETRASLGRSAAEVVRTRFTADRFYDGLSDLYQSLIRMETANP
jgi:glycosyltransferase involved in cell wall biosynthesis